MASESSSTRDWAPVDAVETRKFSCDVREADVTGEGSEGRRMRLVADREGETRLLLFVPADEIGRVNTEILSRGYRCGPDCSSGRRGYCSWRGYLNELEVAHIVVEMLGWRLTPEEQKILDSIDDYGRRAPTGITSPRLT